MRNLRPFALVTATLSLASCSHDQGELAVELTSNPSTWLFQSHTIPIGWMVQLEVAIEERGGVPIQLDHVQLSALDRGTSQTSSYYLLRKEDLDRDASSSLPARGRIVLTPSLGILPDRPTGPITVIVEVLGIDSNGNTVSAALNRDFPLAN